MMTFRHSLTLLAFAVVFATARADTFSISLLSDIHYDPYYGAASGYGHCNDNSSPTYGRGGCDSPLAAVQSAITDAGSLQSDLVMLSGDWLRHGFGNLPMSDAIPAFRTVASFLESIANRSYGTNNSIFALPNFEGALGNNDFVPDYAFDVMSPGPHPLLVNQSTVLKERSLLDEKEFDTFSRCGYYHRDITIAYPTPSSVPLVRVVVLNTVLWSVNLNPALAASVTDPCGQLQFLNHTLEDSRKKNLPVLVIAHIPPGVNIYNILANGLNSLLPMFLNPLFQMKYNQIIKAHADVVRAQFFGHTHMVSTIADVTTNGVPAFIAPAISQVFGNNPSYLAVDMDRVSWKVVRIRQRMLNTTTGAWYWGDDAVSDVVCGGDCGDVNKLNTAALNLITATDEDFAKYAVIRGGGPVGLRLFPSNDGVCDSVCRRILSCSARFLNWNDFTSCVKDSPAPPGTGGGSDPTLSAGDIVGITVCSGLLVGLIVTIRYYATRRTGDSEGERAEQERINPKPAAEFSSLENINAEAV